MTIDSPKGPEREARPAESGGAPSGYTCAFTHAPGVVLCDFCKPVESEVERLTAEVERLTLSEANANAYLGRAVMRAETAEAEVSRLREQLATAVVLPQNWTQQIGWLFDVDEAERYTKVVRLVQTWQGLRAGTGDTEAEESAPVSESVPATPPLQVGDRVEFSSLVPEWRDGTVAGVSPLRIRSDDTDNLTTNPAAVRRLDDLLRASAPSEATLECKEQAENLHSGAEIQGNLPAAVSDGEEWDPCECGGTCASSPPSGGDSDTTPRVWADVRGCEWEEVAPHDELRLIRTDPSHCREVDGPTFSRRYVEAHYGPLVELTPSPSSLPQEGGTDD